MNGVRQSRLRGRSLRWLGGSGVFALALIGQMAVWADEPAASAPGAEHAPIALKEGRFFVTGDDGPRELDAVVDYCLGCHGEPARREEGAEGAQEPPLSPHSLGSPQANHPVDVAYPEADTDYEPTSDLDPRLYLLDGRITCLTCHRHDAPDHAVALPTEQGQLCAACHRL